MMNGVAGALPLFSCTHADCGATFTREWKLNEHLTVHTGERLYQCEVANCGRRFKRKSHLSSHMLRHTGVKQFKCDFTDCMKSFFDVRKLKRHVGFVHGDENCCKCTECSLTFKKRRLFKQHLKEHNMSVKFRCSKDGCAASFDTHMALKAHMKTHTGYSCPRDDCETFEHKWGKLQKHIATNHPATFTCKECKKEFKKANGLRRHKRSHASHKPVLVCPREDCQAFFSTTFNLEHHIRKVHLQLLKYKCSYPDCTRSFAMRESMNRHMLRHDPSSVSLKKRRRPKKSWQKRLDGHRLPHVEENLRNLFALRMRISRRTKLEADLSGLFSERKIPHYVEPEVNLRSLFAIKQPPCLEEKPAVEPVQG